MSILVALELEVIEKLPELAESIGGAVSQGNDFNAAQFDNN